MMGTTSFAATTNRAFRSQGARVIEVVFDVTEDAVIGGEHGRAVAPARH